MKKKQKNKPWLWIILGIVLILSTGLGISFFTEPKTTIQNFPSEEEIQSGVNRIKAAKGIDDYQALIEFFAIHKPIPCIKWWEINSLQELDKWIAFVNNTTRFLSFKEVLQEGEFNKQIKNIMNNKSMFVLTSIIPRKNDNTPDWKGIKKYEEYSNKVLEPIVEERSLKNSFVTEENYQELERRLRETINVNLSSILSRFASSNINISNFNQLINEYLNEIFRGCVYSNVFYNELGKRLGISNHQDLCIKKTHNSVFNENLGIYLNKFHLEKSCNHFRDENSWLVRLIDLSFIINELLF